MKRGHVEHSPWLWLGFIGTGYVRPVSRQEYSREGNKRGGVSYRFPKIFQAKLNKNE